MNRAQHMPGTTMHARRGEIDNTFTYGVDYVLIDPDHHDGPRLFSRNGFNLAAVHDRNHGGTPRKGKGPAWAREVFANAGLHEGCKLQLLTQPTFIGYIFNPVSFWIASDRHGVRAVIAEVNNTYGDRHSYLCHLPKFTPIQKTDRITAKKVFHVSPFQEVKGTYHFSFDIDLDKINIRIALENHGEGVIATLTGPLKPLTNMGLLRAFLRRPLGALRTTMLIHWQALKLSIKGATFRPRPTPPNKELSS